MWTSLGLSFSHAHKVALTAKWVQLRSKAQTLTGAVDVGCLPYVSAGGLARELRTGNLAGLTLNPHLTQVLFPGASGH